MDIGLNEIKNWNSKLSSSNSFGWKQIVYILYEYVESI